VGKERQIVEFILEGSHKKLTKSLGKAQDKLKDLADKTDSLFMKSVSKAGRGIIGAMGMLSEVTGKLIAPMVSHVGTLEQYRKEAGLTFAEIHEFSSEVISSSTKYGVALSRVSTMATFIGKGLGTAREQAIKLSGAMTDLGDFTGATDETLGDLSRDLHRLFNVEAERAQNLMYGLGQVARDSHAPLEDVAAALANSEEALRVLPIEESTKQLGSFVAVMIESGAEAKHYNEVLGQLGDTSSASRLKFDAIVQSGGGMREFMQDITRQVDVFRGRLQDGTVTQAGYNRAIENLSTNFGLSSFTMEKMADSWDNMSDRTRAFDVVQGKSVEENRAAMEARASGLTRFGKKMEAYKNTVMGYFNDLWGPDSAIWGWLTDVTEGVEKFIVKTTDAIATVHNLYTGDKNIVDFVAKNDFERYTQEKGIIKARVNLMQAKGLDVEASRYGKEQLADLEKRYQGRDIEVPPAVAPSPDQAAEDNSELTAAMKEVAANTRSMKSSNEELARKARLEGARSNGINGGRNRATAASEGII
jgi:hypothetical protein